MTRKLFLFAFLFSNIIAAQTEPNVTYFKDKYGRTESLNGPYALKVEQVNDSVITHTFYKVKNGQKSWSKSYLGDRPYGVWARYDKKGNVESKLDYTFVVKHGEYIPKNAKTIEDLGIDVMSDSNNKKIQRHIRDKFRYPEIAQEGGIQGKVIVQFTIDKDGKVDNLRILKGVHISLDTECFRMMNSLKELEPYSFDDKNVMVYRTIPITFRLL
ncbi:MAG: energy transducer TonB [Flavobacteriaceae bacterium]